MKTLPRNMAGLPVDQRGYPVPWFVAWIDGSPEFRAMDPDKLRRAVKDKLCWVCGGRLGVHIVFVAGPMCGINRTSAEPPSHAQCAEWSARNCPFLTNPRMVRREDDLVNNSKTVTEMAGVALTRNPGVTMLWNCRDYSILPDRSKGGKPLFMMGEPEQVTWYREGRPATREEVIESVETGLPALEHLARSEPGGLEALQRYRRRFEPLLPKS